MGQHGCAFGEDTEGKVFGYQIYENAQQVVDFKTAREEKMKAAGMSASDSASATGTILYAKCSKALFDVFPGGADVRNLVGGGIDHTEWAFSHLPLGNYIVDGTQYAVSSVEGGITTVVTTGSDGVKHSYTMTAGAIKDNV